MSLESMLVRDAGRQVGNSTRRSPRSLSGKGGRHKTIRIEGLESVIKRLRQLPEQAQRHAIRPALRKSGTIVAKAARKLAPRGAGLNPNGTARKHLHQTIKTTGVKWYRKTGNFAVVIGPEKYTSPHSHLVHDGTAPHLIRLGKAAILNNVVLPAGFVIQHPGAKANPFMDKAADQTRGPVQAKLNTEILAGIEKQVKKLASKK